MMAQDLATSLEVGEVIPDVLASGTSIPSTLTVVWPNATLDTPGKELGREDTQPEPTIHLSPPPKESSSNNVLIMADPDLLTDNDQQFGQVRHWLATGVKVGADGKVTVAESKSISPYIGPAPLPNYISARPHRYVFILARPRSSGSDTAAPEFSKNDLQDLQKQYPTFQGPQDAQDLKDRWGFNAQNLINSKQLEVVAANYMRVAGTLKSAVDNFGMTMQAGANKVLGK